MSRTGKTAILEQFVADGFSHMFGNPGTVEQGFLDELGKVGSIQYILGLQETVAAGIADGYARATGGPALLQLHSGVGLGNAIGMLYQSLRGGTPLVVIAGEAGVAYESMDAQMAADLVAMARPVTKYATRVVHPGSLVRIVRRAVKMAMTPPRGPVFVALPMDVLDALNDEPILAATVPHTEAAPVPELVAEAAGLLAPARHPVIVVGDGVSVAGATAELTAIAERLGADVFGAQYSEVNIDSRHPLFRGELGHMFGTVSTQTLHDADAVLVVGTYLLPEVFPSLETPFRPGTPVVHIDLNDYEIAKNHPVSLGLVADPKATLAALDRALDQLQGPQDHERARQRLELRRAEKAEATADPGGDGMLEVFMRALAERVPKDVVVFDEGLTSSPVIGAHLPPRLPGHWFLTRGGSLGVGIPGAIGVKLALPDKTVLGFTGDGGAMYTIQALATAARYRIGAKLVVCNNHRYSLLDHNIDHYWAERGIAPHPYPEPFGLAAFDLGFADIARGLGAAARRVDKPDQVEEAIESMLGDPDTPYLIDLIIDQETNS